VDEVEAVLFERPEPFHILDFEFAIWWHPGQLAIGWFMAMASCCWLGVTNRAHKRLTIVAVLVLYRFLKPGILRLVMCRVQGVGHY
jgi:hypothetical protein